MYYHPDFCANLAIETSKCWTRKVQTNLDSSWTVSSNLSSITDFLKAQLVQILRKEKNHYKLTRYKATQPLFISSSLLRVLTKNTC